HILVTTPESVYLLLTSKSGRKMLSTVETVIVDEIHALAGNKRGSHLTLSLERLEALTPTPLKRVGISATQKPIKDMARYLVGNRKLRCNIIDTGHVRERDLQLALPGSPLEAIMSNEIWQDIYAQLETLIKTHKQTLIFVNTRRLAERAARFLAERVGEENVMAHHGSLSKEKRHEAEQRLKDGKLPCLLATASLELGIDIGDVDLVCQLGSPRSIAAFLQRVGRSGHAVAATPKGRLFPLSRDDLVESVALLDAANRGELDKVIMPDQPLDVLSQQIVAEVGGQDWEEDALYKVLSSAWPYRNLQAKQFNEVVRMLAQGFSTRRGRRAAHIHYDAVNKRLRARRGARLTALTNGGAIPDLFDCDVILAPEGFKVGTVNEDFAFESIPGNIFQLGNTSYRILKIEMGKMHVEDAKGQPPNIPFWIGEAPGRTNELSFAVSRLRDEVSQQLTQGMEACVQWLIKVHSLSSSAAEQITAYLAASQAALTVMPTQKNIVLERFLDEVGDMHLVIHSPFGSRINKAWGLSLRKRFCRKFNFELQAAALDDSIVLSLSATHSFPLEEVAGYLKSQSVRHLLIQALLDAPMFEARWRWNATIALAVRRNHNGKRSPPYFQRSDAEDLVAVVFPDQIACFENIAGEREVPDHPLINQAISDCLHETMDIVGLENLLQKIEQAEIKITVADLTAPSPMAQAVLNASPYAFLDDVPAEERRTMAVQSRSTMNPVEAAELSQLDAAAIDKVRAEAWPDVRTADELHDGMVLLGFITKNEALRSSNSELGFRWQPLLETLMTDNRATTIKIENGETLWVAAERLAEHLLIHKGIECEPKINSVVDAETPTERETAIVEIMRSRLEGLGPVTVLQLAQPLALPASEVELAMLALEQEGFVVRGHFTAWDAEEWCDRRLLARVHRYTIKRLRSEIEPVSASDLMRFLLNWQGLTDKGEGQEAVASVVRQLEGFSVAAGAWEKEILAARLQRYTGDQLDSLCSSGQLIWTRLNVSVQKDQKKISPVRHTPLVLLNRQNVSHWRRLAPLKSQEAITLSSSAQKLLESMKQLGAAFFVDLVQVTGLLRTQLEDALGELVNHGLVTSDNFAGLRALITPSSKRPRISAKRGWKPTISPFDSAGRWSLLQPPADTLANTEDIEFIAHTLLRRYGIVFRKLLERESILPPWRDLLRVYWRMEARGEIRGGRFVQGFSGEQFALPEAIGSLRSIRRQNGQGDLIAVCAADPLNLIGIILPGEKVSAKFNNRIVYRDGIPVATQKGKDDVVYLSDVDEETAWQTRMLLTRKQKPANLLRSPPQRF
ncbi:MAG TPA: ATP-dependent DNA helicase, partial [Gammaproteobacteria bacterium]|nr:ATP-dependent DNA helicase [Gammaproteobacteria bacterium]